MLFLNKLLKLTRTKNISLGAPASASLTALLGSTSLANGALAPTQPDVPRQLVYTVAPGAADITAGTLTVVYTDTTGTQRTDVLSLVTESSVTLTLLSSRAVASAISHTVASLAGGSSPTITIGTNTALGVPNVPLGATDVWPIQTFTDGTPDAVAPTHPAGNVDPFLITPGTAPNGTHVYTWLAEFLGG